MSDLFDYVKKYQKNSGEEEEDLFQYSTKNYTPEKINSIKMDGKYPNTTEIKTSQTGYSTVPRDTDPLPKYGYSMTKRDIPKLTTKIESKPVKSNLYASKNNSIADTLGGIIGFAEDKIQQANSFIKPIIKPLSDARNTFVGQKVEDWYKSQIPVVGQIAKASEVLRPIFPKAAEPIDVATDSFINSGTLGFSNYMFPRTVEEKQAIEKNPIANTVGELAGYISPGMAIEKGVVKALPKLATIAGEKLLPATLKSAARAGISGAAMGGIEGGLSAATEGEPILSSSGKKALEFGATGAAFGGALTPIAKGVSSAFKGIKNLKARTQPVNPDAGYNAFKNDINKSGDKITDKYSWLKNDSKVNQGSDSNFDMVGKPYRKFGETKFYDNGSFESVKTNPKDTIYQNYTTRNLPYDKPTLDRIVNELDAAGQKEKVVDLDYIAEAKNRKLKVDYQHYKDFKLEDLPTDKEELGKVIRDIKELEGAGLDINLQLFSEAQKKFDSISKVYSKTIKNSKMFTQAEKDMLESKDFAYNRKSEQKSIEEAQKRIANSIDGERKELSNSELFSGSDIDTMFGIMEKDLELARSTGDYSKVNSMLKNVRKGGTEGGRTVQAFAKYSRTTEGKLAEAQRTVDNFEDAVKKQNPKVAKEIEETTKVTKKYKDKIKNDTEKAIDQVFGKVETNFPEMLKNKISKALSPKTPEDKGFIRNMIDDLFSEAKESIKSPKPTKIDNSIDRLSDAYNFREYAGEIRNKAKDLLKAEFKDSPETLKILDDYFDKGFKPPHSQKLLNDVLSKRLGGLNQGVKTGNASNKPSISDWVKDWYSSGRESREKFVDSIIAETGLSGDEARSLKNTLDSKLHEATKQTKDRLLESVMSTKTPSIVKKGTEKLTQLTNIGLLENKKFTGRISEKLSPIVKQVLKENNINLNDVVRSSIQEGEAAKATLIRDVFKNTNVDDKEIVKLLDLVNKEFKTLSKQKREQILSGLLKEKTSTSRTMVEKLREKINLGVYGDEVDSVIQDAIKQKYNLPTLSNDEVKFITETMDSVNGIDIRSEPYLEAMAKVEKLILEKVPASLSQKIGSGGFVSMLGNLTSPLINVTGNTLLAAPEIASNPLRRLIDKGISKGLNTGNFTVGKTSLKTLGQGAKQGARSVKRDFLGGRDLEDIPGLLKGKTIREKFNTLTDISSNPINTDTSMTNYGDKFEVGNRLAFDNKFGRTLENIVGTNMKIGDIPFNKAYYEDTLQQLMKANNVTEPTEDMFKTAFQVSQERTFKDKNLLSGAAVGVKNLPTTVFKNFFGQQGEAQRGLNIAKEIPQVLANTLIPFAKTPANLIKRGLEYSPLGLVEGGGKLLANKGNMSMMKQREIVDRLTRGTVGTGMLGLGALGYKAGMITDARDKNFDTEKLKQQNGVLPDALNVFGKTIDLKRFQPFTTPIIAGSRLMQGKGGDAITSAVDSMAGAINQYSDMSMLQSLAKASQLFASSESANPPDKSKILLDIATSLPKQYTPSILKKLTYALDPFERDLSSDSSGQYAINSIIGKLPGVSQTFPAKVDAYGEKIKSYDGNNSLANTMLNPYMSKTKRENPVSNEALRLNKSKIDEDLKNTVIPKEVSKDLGKVSLTPDQQSMYQKLMGDKAQLKIKTILKNPEYLKLDDNSKAIAFSRALDLSRTEAKEEMLKKLGVNKNKNKLTQKQESAEKNRIYNKLKLK